MNNKNLPAVPMPREGTYESAMSKVKDLECSNNELRAEVERLKRPIFSTECPWPESVWTMTEKEYVVAIPNPELRTAISGFLMRLGWQVRNDEVAALQSQLKTARSDIKEITYLLRTGATKEQLDYRLRIALSNLEEKKHE